MKNGIKKYLEELVGIKPMLPANVYESLFNKAVDLEKTEERLLTAPEVAKRLGIGRTTLWKWTREGLLPFYQLPGGQFRVKESHLEAFIEKYRTTHSPDINEFSEDDFASEEIVN